MLNNFKILHIDDSPDSLALVKKEVENQNIKAEIIHSNCKKDIKKHFSDYSFDLIISEFSTNDMKFNEIIKLSKSKQKPLILFTDQVTEEDVLKYLNDGMFDCVIKNKITGLAPTIKKALDIVMNNIDNVVENKNHSDINIPNDYCQNPEFFNLFLDAIPDIIFVYELKSKIIRYVNRTGEIFCGLSKKDIINNRINNIFSKELIESQIKIHTGNRDQSLPFEMDEIIIRSKDNSQKYLLIKSFLVNQKDKESDLVLIVAEDNTIRKKEEFDLTKNKLRFLRLFESAPIAIAFVNEYDSTIVDVNQRYLELVGFKRDEIIGNKAKDLHMWVYPDQRNSILKLVKEKKTLLNLEVKLRSKQGALITTLMSVEYMEFPDNKNLFLFMAQDITDREKADKEVKKSLEKEKDLNILKTSFISMISHELRTPLTTIMLSADLLKRFGDKWSEEERLKHFQRIQDTVLKMTQLMENVLTVGRLEAGKFDFHPESLDIPSFCNTIVENIEFNNAGKYKIIYVIHGEEKGVRADENLLWLILSNLLSNAIKYSPLHSEVNFDVQFSENEIEFIIADHGIGIPQKDLENLFQLFYRATNVGVTSGYGLGLNIVKRCVQAHGGTIKVDSKENEGTIFTVKIPIEP